ncbi:uncharacterized protein LOC129587917 [Paramacrobiotus metropolitanus]|uniref:uncharacterized protein LOC129587917 n=1 Tax=Paramacrobiotus metropolitanus TaxID=2943436 RepID=UPI00244593CE|nr:uncharacterized protein LOC129587917 [Paramacrobiotus metropolitanus]
MRQPTGALLFSLSVALIIGCTSATFKDPNPWRKFYKDTGAFAAAPLMPARQMYQPEWHFWEDPHYQLQMARQMDDQPIYQVAEAQLLPSGDAAERYLRQEAGETSPDDEAAMYDTQHQDASNYGQLAMGGGPGVRKTLINDNEFIFGLKPYIRTDPPMFGGYSTPGVPAGGASTVRPLPGPP